MNEEVMAVLMYLFENKQQSGEPLVAEKLPMLNELREAGFAQSDIYNAFFLLDRLTLSEQGLADRSYLRALNSVRIFSPTEYERLGSFCCGFLIFLQSIKILNPITRELVLDCLLGMSGEITLADAKWAVLMVLFHQPEEKKALEMMEELILEESSDSVH